MAPDLKTEATYVDQITDTPEDELAREEKALVRKIDLYLLPTIWIMYLLSYMDRTNIGNAKVAGMAKDLKLSSGQYSLALVVFFISYVFFEIPSNLILSKTRPSRYLPVMMATWGVVTCLMSLVKSFHGLVALRFVIGMLESAFAPGVLLLLSSWYKRDELAKRFALYISAAVLSGAFGGLMAGAITTGLNGARGLAGWRWLFIVEGALTTTWAIIASFILLDFPATSKRLTPRERALAISRLQADRVASKTGDTTHLSVFRAIFDALSNWRVWLLIAGYMVIVGSSTLSYFYPSLMLKLGYKTSKSANFMTVPIYSVAFVAVVATGYFMDKAPRYRGLVIASWLSLATISGIVICAVYNYTVRYVFLVLMAAGLWAANGLALAYAAATLSAMPQETRAVALAAINCMGNLASIYGAYLFPSSTSPHFEMGFIVTSCMAAFGTLVYLALHILVHRHPMIKTVGDTDTTHNPMAESRVGDTEHVADGSMNKSGL